MQGRFYQFSDEELPRESHACRLVTPFVKFNSCINTLSLSLMSKYTKDERDRKDFG